MRAFEVHINGKKLCVAGLEQGHFLFSVACGANKQGRSGVGLGVTGILPTNSTVRWKQRTLQTGDQVSVKVIEVQTADTPTVLQEAPRDSRKYEKAYVRRMAKEFGWTIQTRATKRLKNSK